MCLCFNQGIQQLMLSLSICFRKYGLLIGVAKFPCVSTDFLFFLFFLILQGCIVCEV